MFYKLFIKLATSTYHFKNKNKNKNKIFYKLFISQSSRKDFKNIFKLL